ncbi:MAG: hypothetical protein E7588_05310 [Ruminococcaceae bacterium]|nr:hypothetical protein [Oscillospiraceae bacterium]
MKFLLFSDFHYVPGTFLKGDIEGMKEILDAAEREKVDFIIHAGDLCHGPSHVADFVSNINDFHIPVYHCLGNHDADRTPYEDVLKYYNMPDGYYYFDDYGCRMIVCDPNYYLLDGEYVKYSMGNYYAHPDERDWMPPEQLAWLEKTIDESPLPCILISHESFERCDGVKNRYDVQKIINEANKKNKNRVLMCINGHHHRDFIRVLDNVIYFDMNSSSYDWVGKPHNAFPEELCKKHCALNKTVVFNSPLYAIVTVEGSRVKIKGMETTMFMGINRREIGYPVYDDAGREVTPAVQNADITLR